MTEATHKTIRLIFWALIAAHLGLTAYSWGIAA